MIELPEAISLGQQLNVTLTGKTVTDVFNATSPHKFAFFNGDPLNYKALLTGRTIVSAKGVGLFVEIVLDQDVRLIISEGVKLTYGNLSATVPDKYQLLLTFNNDGFLAFSVAMYGVIWAGKGDFDNPYYLKSVHRISPMSLEFDKPYFLQCLEAEKKDLSLKAFLATEQRFPGLCNGVLQDILYKASLHPKRKCSTLTDADKQRLWESISHTLTTMTANGGRDTETDLFGAKGGYKTLLSKNTLAQPCPACQGSIQKESYLGGAIYYCPNCQPLIK